MGKSLEDWGHLETIGCNPASVLSIPYRISSREWYIFILTMACNWPLARLEGPHAVLEGADPFLLDVSQYSRSVSSFPHRWDDMKVSELNTGRKQR